MPEIFINGQSIEAREDQTVLQVALANGIFVPYFCWHPQLSVPGNCRICMVEVASEGQAEGEGWLDIACNMPVTKGMRVFTDSTRVRARRKETLQFITLNHPVDCGICDKAGECTLQDYHYEYNGSPSVSLEPKVHATKHFALSERIVLDNERCILCTRCVRFTNEVSKTFSLGVQNRGDHSLIRPVEDGAFERDPGSFFEWVKFRSHLSRGVTVGTMLQDEALYFLRIGTFLERADNTARLLDVKFHALAGEYFGAGNVKESQEVDFYHWSAILRSVSGFEVYRKVYRNVIRPERVAELLILRPDMPRSLAACMNEAVANLELVANEQSSETMRRAGRLRSDLQYGRIDEILATGLHAYLTQFLDRVGALGVGISRDFLVPMAV